MVAIKNSDWRFRYAIICQVLTTLDKLRKYKMGEFERVLMSNAKGKFGNPCVRIFYSIYDMAEFG